MKVLYNILNPLGLGADRWLYEGYRHAFEKAGHEVFPVAETDDFLDLARSVRPDLIFLDFHPFMDYSRRVQPVSPEQLAELKTNGTKIFCMTGIGLDREEDKEENIAFFRKYLHLFDICFSQFTPETTKDFKTIFGKDHVFVPHAADETRFFPEQPDPRFVCDIAFVGSRYTQKRTQFDELLMPLLKKYHVRVYGSGWTFKGRMLRTIGGVARRLKLTWLANFASARRMTISIEDERKLYASAKICVNVHEYFKDGTVKGFSNEREFKVPACGGFEITDYIPGMERYYELGKEIVAVKSKEEWFQEIDYYLHHDEERKKIQNAGTARVLNNHTYSHRVAQLVDIYRTL